MSSHRKALIILGFSIFIATTFAQTIPPGIQQMYDLTNDVRMYDLKKSHLSTGVRMTSKVNVSSVWNKDKDQLLQFDMDSFKVSTKSTDSRLDQSYKQTKSNLDSLSATRFYLHLSSGKAIKLYSNDGKDISLLNLKRGIASLFQFNFQNGIISEDDVSGLCSVLYKSKTSTSFEKIKTECTNWALKLHRRTDKPLDIFIKSFQDSSYKFDQNNLLLDVISREYHIAYLEANHAVGSKLESLLKLSHSGQSEEVPQLEQDSVESIFTEFQEYEAKELEAEVDGSVHQPSESLKKSIRNFKEKMIDENYGKHMTSLILTDFVLAAREARTEELIQILRAHSTQNIRSQIIDILGAAQTFEAHKAITSVFNFDTEDDFPYLERYVQALAVGTRPKPEIIDDIFEKLNDKILSNPKLEDSTIQTLGAMCYHYAQLFPDGYENTLVQSVQKYLTTELSKCKKAYCKEMYIRGLQNLRNPTTIPTLIDIALTEERSCSIAAMKALRAFNIKDFSEDSKKVFERIFYQIPKKFDSSARTLALDILFDLRPNSNDLRNLISYLKSNDKAYEVKTYLLQRLYMIAEKCPYFNVQFKKTLYEDCEVNNYDKLAPKGFTTALQRQFSSSPSFNGTLVSFQEVENGVLKRGVVDMVLEAGESSFSAFKLELFTSGMNGLLGESSDEEEEDTPTAGMGIIVQGAYLRPLEFFNGKSELMGHVWSGTASDPTPAYQATTLLHDHEEYIILQNGGTTYFRVLSATSVDLNGQIQFSLWNRNAHCQVDQNTGLAVVGVMSYGTSYAYLENKFTVTQEPKINLISDIDFYSDVLLCLQLSVPSSTLWHNIVKSQIIKGTDTSVRNTVNMTYQLPARTLALNHKNNEMCSIILENE